LRLTANPPATDNQIILTKHRRLAGHDGAMFEKSDCDTLIPRLQKSRTGPSERECGGVSSILTILEFQILLRFQASSEKMLKNIDSRGRLV